MANSDNIAISYLVVRKSSAISMIIVTFRSVSYKYNLEHKYLKMCLDSYEFFGAPHRIPSCGIVNESGNSERQFWESNIEISKNTIIYSLTVSLRP